MLLLDNAKKPGRKILISGGGRCNFTNHQAGPHAFLSGNPHFCKSALAALHPAGLHRSGGQARVNYHEKTLGQLFCDESAKEIVEVLLTECDWAGVTLQCQTEILSVSKTDDGLPARHQQGRGALPLPGGGHRRPLHAELGATPYGFKLAEQFGLNVLPTRAGLVPFTLHQEQKEAFADLAGVSLPVAVTAEDGTCFKEAMLFTHRGLSGPAILQISSFWLAGERSTSTCCRSSTSPAALKAWAPAHPAQELKTVLGRELPKRFVDKLVELGQLNSKPMRQYNEREAGGGGHPAGGLADTAERHRRLSHRRGDSGRGGTNELSSKTMEARKVPGLYFVGEVVDVTGWLGGYNFQWAWSSGWVAGQYC